MTHPELLRARLGALSVGIALIAGCAVPVAPVGPSANAGVLPTQPGPVAAGSVVTPPTQGASIVTPPTQGTAVLPAAPKVDARNLDLVATFAGEPQVGFQVSVFDAVSGEPVALVSDLAGAKGLAVLNQGLMTDAAGGVSVKLAGLSAGTAVRVVFHKGSATLETLVTGDGSDLTSGAPQALTLLATGTISVDAATTAAARMSKSVLRVCQLLSAEKAAPIIAAYVRRLAALTRRLSDSLGTDRDLALRVVQADGAAKEDSALEAAIRKIGALKEAMEAVAEVVGGVAKEAGDVAAADPKVKAALTNLIVAGTPLTVNLDGALTLRNKFGGGTINALNGNFADITRRTSPPSGGGNGAAAPVYVEVDTYDELEAALADESTSHIRLMDDISGRDAYRLALIRWDVEISRSVTIDGNGNAIDASILVSGDDVTLADFSRVNYLTVTADDFTMRGFTDQASQVILSSGHRHLVEDCQFRYGTTEGETRLDIRAAVSDVEVTGCTFTDAGTVRYRLQQEVTSQPLVKIAAGVGGVSVAGCEFVLLPITTYRLHDLLARPIGIELSDNETDAADTFSIANCTFSSLEEGLRARVEEVGTELEVAGCTFTGTGHGIYGDYVAMAGRASDTFVVSGNTFSGTMTNSVYMRHDLPEVEEGLLGGIWETYFADPDLDNTFGDELLYDILLELVG